MCYFHILLVSYVLTWKSIALCACQQKRATSSVTTNTQRIVHLRLPSQGSVFSIWYTLYGEKSVSQSSNILRIRIELIAVSVFGIPGTDRRTRTIRNLTAFLMYYKFSNLKLIFGSNLQAGWYLDHRGSLWQVQVCPITGSYEPQSN
jgi:hypothetical protein